MLHFFCIFASIMSLYHEMKYRQSLKVMDTAKELLKVHQTERIFLSSPVGKAFSLSPVLSDKDLKGFSPLSLSPSQLSKVYGQLVSGNFYYFKTFDNFNLKIKPKKSWLK